MYKHGAPAKFIFRDNQKNVKLIFLNYYKANRTRFVYISRDLIYRRTTNWGGDLAAEFSLLFLGGGG